MGVISVELKQLSFVRETYDMKQQFSVETLCLSTQHNVFNNKISCYTAFELVLWVESEKTKSLLLLMEKTLCSLRGNRLRLTLWSERGRRVTG